MFLLNNIYNRNYNKEHPSVEGVVFDISDAQLKNAKNADWNKIAEGSVVCVVTSSRNLSTMCKVEKRLRTETPDGEGGFQHVIVARLAGKVIGTPDMTKTLNEFGVSNPYLSGNKFTPGFNVADLGRSLDALKVSTPSGPSTVGEL